MKKRLISLLLAVLMVATMFSGMTVSASADANVTTVTLSSGDTVYGLCQKLGVDYNAYKNLIMALNGFTSEAQFSKLPIGGKIILPVSAAAAAALAGSGSATGTIVPTTGTVGTTAGTTPITSGSTTSLPAGDRVAYYLVSYTIKSGETISGIYANWGLSYKTYSAQILKLNNLANYNAIPAGKTLLLPTTSPAVPGASYYTVMAHTMKTGDSAYNIVCTDYGLNFNASQKMLQALNNRDNMGNFYVGESLYIPVAGIVSATTTVTPSTGSSTTTGTVTSGVNYNLVAQTPTNGSFIFEVDGNAVTSAAAGKTVKVVASPNAGYGVESVKVVKVGDAATSIPVNSDNSFTMPAYSVTVSVTFRQATAYKVNVDSAVNGSVAALVDNVRVDSAYTGSKVTIKTIPATGFMVDNVRVTYNDYRDTVAVENSVFTMPNFPVTVTATFKEDPNYDPSKGHSIYTDAVNGKIETFIGDAPVSTANVGDRITVKVTPHTNYTVENIKVYYADFSKTVDIEKGAFTMPDSPVTIVATIKATADARFDITKVANTEGYFALMVGEEEVSAANVGQEVQVVAGSDNPYFNWQPVVTKTGDSSTTVPVDENNVFIMPDFPVTVRLKFYQYHNIILDASNGTRGYFNVTAASNGMAIDRCGAGVELKVTVWGYDQYLYTPGSVILTYEDGSTYTVNGASFIMPDCDVKVRVNFNPVTSIYAHAISDPTGQGNEYYVGGVYLNDTDSGDQEVRAGIGGRVYVTPYPVLGYDVKDIYFSYYDVANNLIYGTPALDKDSGRYYFDMPETREGTQLELFVSFKEIPNYAIVLDYANDPYGDNTDKRRGSFSALTSLGIVSTAVENAKVTLLFSPTDGHKVDLSKVAIFDEKGNDVTTAVKFNRNDYSFFMPAYPVRVVAAFNSIDHKIIVSEIPLMADGTRPEGVLSVQLENGIKYTDDMLNINRELPTVVREGSLITVINQSRDGYILRTANPIVVTRVHGGADPVVTMIDDDRFTFQMPDDDVVITAYYIYDAYNIVAEESANGSFTVPKQAAWGDESKGNAEVVEITNIVPKPGFEFDWAQIKYIDASGTVVTKKLEGTSFSLTEAPQSEVIVTVVFKAKPNSLKIDYQFLDTPNPSNRYKVNLTVDGKYVSINRNEILDLTDYTTYFDTVDITSGGIETGKTVIITRDETAGVYDQNFKIANVLVYLNGNPIDVVVASGQYHFVMPSVANGDELIVRVTYEKLSTDKFSLVAVNTGMGEASVAFYDQYGTPIDKSNLNSKVYFEITPKAGSAVDSSFLPYIEYTDIDGALQSQTVTIDGAGYSFIAPAAMPQTGVTVKYKLIPASYSIVVKGYLNGSEFTDARFATAAPSTAQWGSSNVVSVKLPVDPGYAISSVTISYKDIAGTEVVDQPIALAADGSYQFSIPTATDSTVTVKATYVACSASISYVNMGNGSGVVQAITASNGSVVPEGGSVTVGDTFTLVPAADAGSEAIELSPGYYAAVLHGEDLDSATLLTDTAGVYTIPNGKIWVVYQIDKISYSFDVARYNEEGLDGVAGKVMITDGSYEISKAGKGDEVIVVPLPGYKVSYARINYYDSTSDLVYEECTIEDGCAKYTIGDIPTSVLHFQLVVEEDTNQLYHIMPSPQGTGHTANDIVFQSTIDSGETVSTEYYKTVTATITLSGGSTLDSVKILYKDFLGVDQTAAYTQTVGANPNEVIVSFGADIMPDVDSYVTFEYTVNLP